MATTIKVMLNKDRKSTNGKYPIVIRIIHNRKKKLVYMGYKVSEEHFDETQQRVIWSSVSGDSKSQIDDLNKHIALQIKNIEYTIHKLERKFGNDFSADDIMLESCSRKRERNMYDYIRREIDAKHKTNRHGTASLYESSLNSLLRFTSGKKILFKDITFRFISDYIDHLAERGVSKNTINMYLRNIRSIYNKAKKEGLVSQKISPFSDVKMNSMPTVKRSLPKSKIKEISELDLSHSNSLERVRDLFMFSFFSRGMSFVDMVFLKHSDISMGVIYYKRNKTRQNMEVAITPQLQLLIDKYKSLSPYVLPFLDDSSKESLYSQYRKSLSIINFNLKRIGNLVGLGKPLTTYVARHSWATIAKTEGASIAAISEGLGHTTERTTQIYLRAFDRSIIDLLNEKVAIL